MNKKTREMKSHDRNNELALDLAALGYPGFSYLKTSGRKAPAEVVLSALQVANLEARLVEALPWVLLECWDLDWDWLVRGALLNDLQNKLGFLTNLARKLAEKSGRPDVTLPTLGPVKSRDFRSLG